MSGDFEGLNQLPKSAKALLLALMVCFMLLAILILTSGPKDKEKRRRVEQKTELYKVFRCDPISYMCYLHATTYTKEDCEKVIKAAKRAQPTVERVCIKENTNE